MPLGMLGSPLIPWADTGVQRSVTNSGAVEIDAAADGLLLVLGLHGSISVPHSWNLRVALTNIGTIPSPDWRSQLFLSYTGDFPVVEVEISQVILGAAVTWGTFHPAVNWSVTTGPYRLGCRYFASLPVSQVNRVEYTGLEYSWFQDDQVPTVYDETVDTENRLLTPFGQTIITERLALGRVSTQMSFAGIVGGTLAKWRTVTIDGTLLPVEGIDEAYPATMQEVADGDFDVLAALPVSWHAWPGGTITYDVEVIDSSGADIAGAEVLDNWLTTPELFNAVQKTPFAATVPLVSTAYPAPVQTSYERPTRDLPSEVYLEMNNTWLGTAGWEQDDLPVILDLPSPLTGGGSQFLPVRVTHQNRVEVDRPNGGRPSSWSINSGANGSVTENALDTVFAVTNIAAVFGRDFATNWRNYIAVGGPEYVVDGYSFLRREYGNDHGTPQAVSPEDVWWWNGYVFLRLEVTASAPATLTLVVSGVELEVFDSHEFGNDPSFIEHAGSRTYTVSLSSGTAEYWVDLSFPPTFSTPGGLLLPIPRPRVDRLELSFSATGTFTVTAMEIARRDNTYSNETQIAFPPNADYLYPAVYVRVDGEATVTLSLPDDNAKDKERTVGFGGAVRFAEPVYFSGSQELTVEQMWQWLGRIEGFAVVYSSSAVDGYLLDPYGVPVIASLVVMAENCVERMSGEVWTNGGTESEHEPTHRLRVARISLVNAHSFTLPGRKILGGGVESVACIAGARGGAGLDFDVIDQDTVTLDTVTSDARGRIHSEPLKAGRIVRFEAA